ncbi:MAG: MucB/RseB C-terminal domain-containing protein [Gammaproteobacteria bacterium]|nr:MucB/RseB C-terminal domain-containing protein [Gammaproteobacteria bacterium]
MKNKITFFTILLLFPFAFVQAVEHNEEIQYWLKKMYSAAHTLNYEGIFVYGQHNELSSMKIIHSAGPGGERERLISMDGTGREVIRDHKKVTCYLPDKKSIVVEQARPQTMFPPRFPVNISQLEKNYHLSLAGIGEVAGYSSQVIDIKPRDNLRYGHRLWVEKVNGLLLKTHLLTEDDAPVEQFMFTHLNIMDQIPEEWLKPKRDMSNMSRFEAPEHQEQSKAEASHNWVITKMPNGFKHNMQRLTNLTDNTQPVEHLMISDGLASVSVFIEQGTGSQENLIGGSHMGAVHAFGRVIDDHHVTVVGEVPFLTVKMIGESVNTQTSHD